MNYQPLSSNHEPQFRQVCADSRQGFSSALDLVLIHNEHDVTGNQPRASLNPLTVLLAVAAWERFIVDIRALATGSWKKPGAHKARPRAAYLGAKRETPESAGPALTLMSSLSGGRLPNAWEIRSFKSWRGKAPKEPVVLAGSDIATLAKEVDAWVRLRNSVAHRCMPQDLENEPYFESDAITHTIQSGWARIVLAVFLQLTDQAIAAIADEAGFADKDKLRLPSEWFEGGEPDGLRGVKQPGVLWGGHELFRP